MNKFNTLPSWLAAAVVLLAGCSGGDSDDGGDADRPVIGAGPLMPSAVTGYGQGSATETASGEVMTATAFIDEYGNAQVVVSPAVVSFGPVAGRADLRND
ncbi:hypothetical protein [Povalibacter sp.]|uniref:hypothetical protein n=1 Tax=Povalibacter sp. TaxID=1962978 RepID=UPI002F3FB20F